MPGYPMGGHSLAGRIGRGYWTRLRAKALYLEDTRGRAIVLVSCDLWSIPGGVADRVAERVGRQLGTTNLGREQIILAATMGGAEDGRSIYYELGWKEGERGPRDPEHPEQGPKRPALNRPKARKARCSSPAAGRWKLTTWWADEVFATHRLETDSVVGVELGADVAQRLKE